MQFRQRRFRCEVVAADHSRPRERRPRSVFAEVDGAFEALGAVDDDDAAFGRVMERGDEGVVLVGAVADAVGLELGGRGCGGSRGPGARDPS